MAMMVVLKLYFVRLTTVSVVLISMGHIVNLLLVMYFI